MARRLTIVHTEWSSGWGGQERRIVAEAKLVAGVGHRVVVVARSNSDILAQAEKAGLETHVLPFRSSVDPVSILGLARFLRQLEVDILNTHSSIDAWVGAWASRWTSTPLLRTRHIGTRIRSHALNFVHRLPARTITTGEVMRRSFIEQTGVAPETVVSIPTGIDTRHFAPAHADAARLRRQLRLNDGVPIVAAVAILRRDKRHEVLLEAVADVASRRPVHLVFAGDGAWREVLQAKADSLGLAGHVTFLGHVDDVRWVIAGASVIASASAIEGVPQALMQALAMERPTVATDVGSVSEVILHERTGLLVPVEDPTSLAQAIERLLAQPEQAASMGRAGRVHVEEHHAEERMLGRLLEVYDQLLECRA